MISCRCWSRSKRASLDAGVRIVAIAMLVAATLSSANSASTERGRLIVQINGFENDSGRAMLALVDRREQFLSRKLEPFRSATVTIRKQQARWVFENLPHGEYAISVYHDANGNGELDSNLLRIPKEAYGFSNNARGTFGPPDYEQASFEISKSETTLIITVK